MALFYLGYINHKIRIRLTLANKDTYSFIHVDHAPNEHILPNGVDVQRTKPS